MNKKQNSIIAIDKSGSYRVYLTISTDMVRQAAAIHETLPTATTALGRVITGAGLMGIMQLKHMDAKLTVQFKGDGIAQEILSTAKENGKVKGYISNPNIDMPLHPEGGFDVGGAIGIGQLMVIRDLGQGEPYVGRIELATGEIADDLTMYFFISEQQSTSFALGVKIGEDGSVLSAAGMIIQMLPDAEEESVDYLESMLAKLQPLSELAHTSEDVDDLLLTIFKDMPEEYGVTILEHRDISWECDCSVERLEKALISIGEKDLREIIEEDGQAELTCQFCRKAYHFDKEHLESLI